MLQRLIEVQRPIPSLLHTDAILLNKNAISRLNSELKTLSNAIRREPILSADNELLRLLQELEGEAAFLLQANLNVQQLENNVHTAYPLASAVPYPPMATVTILPTGRFTENPFPTLFADLI